MIELSNICLSYSGKRVLDKFNLKVNKGDKVLLYGKSGGGKSSILKVMLGFQDADSGKVLFCGEEITGIDFRWLRNQFAYVNQDVTIRGGIVSDILVEISNFLHNSFSGKLDSDILSLLELNEDILNKQVAELSGGERQRLGIAIAISLNRDIYLLDEITSALDTELKDKVTEYFTTTDKTVIAISHDSSWLNNPNFIHVEVKHGYN